MRILVVEDDQISRITLQKALAQQGHLVSVAIDGTTALALLDLSPLPDAIITDLQMTPKDGRALIKTVRDSPRLREMPLVVLSSDRSVDDVRELVLPKPFNMKTLLFAIGLAELHSEVRRDEEKRRAAEHSLGESVSGDSHAGVIK